jgi:hypothetical protein
MFKKISASVSLHVKNVRRSMLLNLVVQRAKDFRRLWIGFAKPGSARIFRLQNHEGLFATSGDDFPAFAHGS